ncbi:MAG: 1-acyl-sn-glycerol-3-phosphate acyltransferase [Sandaracinaceae bacterium]|nr:1-acyl-sn-glycerol-3-phosphate acyltransferase [Sandaracinaceae bacterium]
MAAVYSVARRFFRRAAGLYFVDVQEEGEAHVPRTGPVVFAANHPNSLMDTVLLGSRVPRNIHYLARSGLFAHPLAAAAFRAAGVIPVQRAQDAVEGPGAGPKADNDAAFEAAFEALAAGRAVGIFPEGQNAPTRHVRNIKTGVARIALGAEAQHGFALGVVVVPVGLNYVERERFHTAALVRFGAPIPVARYREQFQADPRAAVRALTDDVQAAMRAVAVHVPDEAQIDLAEDLHALYGAQLRDDVLGSMPDLRMPQEKLLDHATGRPSRAEQLSDRFLAEQLIANAFDWFLRTEPARAKALQKRVNEHERHLGQLRLRGDFAELPGKRLSTRAELLKLTLYAIFMAPVAAYGLFHNFVPYRSPGWLRVAPPTSPSRPSPPSAPACSPSAPRMRSSAGSPGTAAPPCWAPCSTCSRCPSRASGSSATAAAWVCTRSASWPARCSARGPSCTGAWCSSASSCWWSWTRCGRGTRGARRSVATPVGIRLHRCRDR